MPAASALLFSQKSIGHRPPKVNILYIVVHEHARRHRYDSGGVRDFRKKVVIKMSGVQPIEGITPAMLWNAVMVLLGICTIVVLVYKVVEIARQEHERKEKKNKLVDKDLTEEIADKVLEKLEPRFKDIEQKLNVDKNRLDNHEAAIKSINSSIETIKEGMQVTADGLTAILDHELHNGNEGQMQKARDDLQAYTNGLIKKV